MTNESAARKPSQPRARLGTQFDAPPGERRTFSEALKRQIVDESCQPTASVSAVARRYRIATAVLFRWRRAAGVAPAPTGTTFVPVQLAETGDTGRPEAPPAANAGSPVIVERPSPGVEIELVGGRRVRFDRDVDAETMRRVVAALEGMAP
jgi:transposase